MAVSETAREQTITNGIPGREELKIYLEEKLFYIDMKRSNPIPNEIFVEVVDLIENFGEAEGIINAHSTYMRSTENNNTTIVYHGTYDSPMTSKRIEELYKNLRSKLGS
jgi:hypothetical protein